MIERVITGGQTGADIAAWRAAKRFGIPTSGYMPRDYLAEDGCHPEYAETYGAWAVKPKTYPPRTRMNVLGSDMTIVFDTSKGTTLKSMSAGTKLAIGAAMEYGRPSLVVHVALGEPIDPKRPLATAGWIREKDPRFLNMGGNRESKSPGIGAWVEAYLCDVFRALGFKEIAGGQAR